MQAFFYTSITDVNAGYPMLSDARAIIENKWFSEETRVQQILGPNQIVIAPMACREYDITSTDTPIVICPHRFIFNSWPNSSQIGKSSKGGTLLQTAVISWFAHENVLFDFMNNDPHLK